jgi:3-dehydroquinate synthase
MIKAANYNIHFEDKNYKSLNDYLSKTEYSSIFILVDEHTKNKCLPVFLTKISRNLDYQIITIASGENNKTLATCSNVWQELTNLKADRKSILINLGGGMLTDLGGFVAATFKRGIRFINVSTTLLGMVDASVGGKTGVDFNHLKNQIGLFANPELVIIDLGYLKTLPKRELHSGMAEIIKYALTYDEKLWNSIKKDTNLNQENLKNWICRSIEIKSEIVLKDPKEQNLRKILNYGHTIGHAVESYFLNSHSKKSLIHGEAIAIGLICETYISYKQLDFPEKELIALKKIIFSLFKRENIQESDYQMFFELMKHDKKNINGIVLFTLIENIAKHKINSKVDNDLIIAALNFYSL